jgi:hypothetical protein
MNSQTTSHNGGCTCRFVRYSMTTQPLFVHCCHCRWCQRETGASFALNALIEADRVQCFGESSRSSIRHQTAARARKSPVAPDAISQYGATTRDSMIRSISYASELLTSLTTFRPIFKSLQRQSSRGWCFRPTHMLCTNTIRHPSCGPRRVWSAAPPYAQQDCSSSCRSESLVQMHPMPDLISTS